MPCTSTSDGVNGSTIYVHVSKSTSDKREWDKENCCVFCGKLSTNCMKHMMSSHKSEFEVQLIESKPKRSKERAFLKERLRLKGNYKHNCNVIRQGSGKIIPVRSPSSPVAAEEYVPCQFCLGFFFKKRVMATLQNLQICIKERKEICKERKKGYCPSNDAFAL